MNVIKLSLILVFFWMAGCASVPFEKTHFKPEANNPGQAASPAFLAEVPKGYQAVLENRSGAASRRWEYVYPDSSAFYVAVIPPPQRALQNAVAFTPNDQPAAVGAAGDSTPSSGQDARGRFWMERQVADVRVGYKNVPHPRLYLFNYAIESFQQKK